MTTKPYLLDWINRAFLSETDECILFPRELPEKAYGYVRENGKSISAHVWVCTKVHGPRPEGLQACHNCGESRCCNKRHLRWDTRSSNIKQRWQDGTIGDWVIPPHKYQEIRESKLKGIELAQLYGVSSSTITRIRKLAKE